METLPTEAYLSTLKADNQMTDEEAFRYVEFVEGWGRRRARAQYSIFSEVDYLAGAMGAFFFFKSQGFIPASWVFSPFVGNSILTDDNPAHLVKTLTTHLGKMIEAIERFERETPAFWQDDTAALDNARKAWEKATGSVWRFPGRPEDSPLWNEADEMDAL